MWAAAWVGAMAVLWAVARVCSMAVRWVAQWAALWVPLTAALSVDPRVAKRADPWAVALEPLEPAHKPMLAALTRQSRGEKLGHNAASQSSLDPTR